MDSQYTLPVIPIPEEREAAWNRYKARFGKDYPLELIYDKFGLDWQSEVADIDRRIRENDPA